MTIDVNILQNTLCKAMCSEVKIREKSAGLLAVDTPFTFPDGDQYQLYIKVMPGGLLRLTDMGHTLMHLSYEHDIDKFCEGTRGALYEKIKSETSVEEHDGSLCIDSTSEQLAADIFRLGQAITSISDLTFLKRSRIESTFYDDLRDSLFRVVPAEKVKKDYLYEGMANASDYPIDYWIEGREAPVFLFGIPGRDKAKTVTIILEHLLRANATFESILVFSDQSSLPRADLARLTNVSDTMISSLDAESDFRRKLEKKAQLN
ncbi:DUF1828 domain-containing protein [Chlorobium phaeobacteroides]|uniref:Conserved hypothetical cytosolic protein n=1 Tax=Chlorobium phaeobacteroides (strain DSM 266 / SMG 266 / 2430) TaxID=290317 RepID=A1BH54_CHLPD|nr:DUF1828 domain-containing protein [Chlorobium phaeobacteroides]ABL65731.1 conserved hypothetical cytosolic protein [Chlorobium phaeobacteroides DSM 266]